jgi:hypothetical protein
MQGALPYVKGTQDHKRHLYMNLIHVKVLKVTRMKGHAEQIYFTLKENGTERPLNPALK